MRPNYEKDTGITSEEGQTNRNTQKEEIKGKRKGARDGTKHDKKKTRSG